MKSALALVASSLVLVAVAVTACAESASEIPPGGDGAGTPQKEDTSATLPPPSNGGDSGAKAPSNPGTSSGSTSSSTSSSSSSSSSGSTSSSGTGGVPACPWAGDFQKMLEKAGEIQAQAPCDATCNPATHCCLDLFGGAGGGGSSGIPGFDAGMPGGGGIPGGACVSND